MLDKKKRKKDNTKLVQQQLESGFKRTINWNRHQSKV